MTENNNINSFWLEEYTPDEIEILKKKPGVLINQNTYKKFKDIGLKPTRTQKAYLFDLVMTFSELGDLGNILTQALNELSSSDFMDLRVMWGIMLGELKEDNERYIDKCLKARESINARWHKNK